jgi:hypothetical protein
MTSSRLATIEDELSMYGIVKDHTRNFNRRVEWHITCRERRCATVLTMHWRPNLSPEGILKDMRRRGWQIVKNERPLCPECVSATSRRAREIEQRQATPKPRAEPQVVAKPAPMKPTTSILSEMFRNIAKEIATESHEEPQMPTSPETTEPIVKAPQTNSPAPSAVISRAVFGLLEDHLDEKMRQYRDGYSDVKIAEEVGCHESVVRDIRISAFCELIEDARLSSLRAEIEAYEKTLAKAMKQASDDIAALRSRLEQIALTTKSR